MYSTQAKAIAELIQNYFDGIYYGNVDQLRDTFVEGAHLFGEVNTKEYSKSLEDYLEGVKNRKSPHELQEKQEMELIGIEIIGGIARVKAQLQMLGYNYYDFISLSRINGKWKIVNKVFTNV